MDVEELELINKLGLNTHKAFIGEIPKEILNQYASSDPKFSPSAPVLFAIQAIGANRVDVLSAAAIQHYNVFENEGILPAIVVYLRNQSGNLDALEFLAFSKYEKHFPLHLPEIDPNLDLFEWQSLKEHSIDATSAGYAPQSSSSLHRHNTSLNERSKGFFGTRPWLLQFLLEASASSHRKFVDQWWPLVIPALLNYLDTGDLDVKLRGVQLVDLLATHHATKLASSGLVPVFESSVEPCLSFLPPMVAINKTKLIHRPALICLGKLANTYENSNSVRYNARMNYLAREGCLKPFLHSEEKIDLLKYFLESLQLFIDTQLRSLTVIHLHGIIQVFNQILTDPFIDCNLPLVRTTCSVMETSIKWAWPRLEKYRYTLMFGLAKANALDTNAFDLLLPTPEERQHLHEVVAQPTEF